MPAFDTLQVAKELEIAFTPEQAEVLVKAFAHTLVEELATKRDVTDAEQALRRDIERLETKFTTGLSDLKAEMIKWMAGAIAFNLLGTAGLMITLIKTIPH